MQMFLYRLKDVRTISLHRGIKGELACGVGVHYLLETFKSLSAMVSKPSSFVEYLSQLDEPMMVLFPSNGAGCGLSCCMTDPEIFPLLLMGVMCHRPRIGKKESVMSINESYEA